MNTITTSAQRDYHDMSPSELFPVLLQAITQMEEKGMHGDIRYNSLVTMAGRVKSQMYGPNSNYRPPHPPQPSSAANHAQPAPYNSLSDQDSNSPAFPLPSPGYDRVNSARIYQPTMENGERPPSSGYPAGSEKSGSGASYGRYSPSNSPQHNSAFSSNVGYTGSHPPNATPSSSDYGPNNPPWQSNGVSSKPPGSGLTPLQKQILQTHVAAYKHFSRREVLPEQLYHAIANRKPLQAQPLSACNRK